MFFFSCRVLFFCLFVNVLFLTSCTKQNISKPVPLSRPFHWALKGGCETLNPLALKATQLDCLTLSKLVEGTLVQTKAGADGETKILGQLAESWEFETPRRIRIHLKNVRWSNGAPLQSRHFIQRWAKVLADPSLQHVATLLFSIRNARLFSRRLVALSEVGIRAPDQSTILLDLEVNDPSLLGHLSHPALSAEFGATPPLVNPWIGPYKIEIFSPSKLLFTPNPFLQTASPSIEKISVSFFQSQSQLRDSFTEGTVDFFEEAHSSLQTSSQVINGKLTFPSGSHYLLVLNPRKKLFSLRANRKAMMLAIRREEFSELLKWDHVLSELSQPVKPDLQQAKKTAQETRFNSDPSPFLIFYPPQKEGRELAENLSVQWTKSLGLNFKLTPLSSLPTAESDFHAAIVPIQQDSESDTETFRPLWEKFLTHALLFETQYVPFEASLLPWNLNSRSSPQALEEWLVNKEYLVLPLINISRTVFLRPNFKGLNQDVFFLWDFSSLSVN